MSSDAKAKLSLLLKPRVAAEALAISQRTLWELTAPRGPIPVLRIPGSQGWRGLEYPD